MTFPPFLVWWSCEWGYEVVKETHLIMSLLWITQLSSWWVPVLWHIFWDSVSLFVMFSFSWLLWFTSRGNIWSRATGWLEEEGDREGKDMRSIVGKGRSVNTGLGGGVASGKENHPGLFSLEKEWIWAMAASKRTLRCREIIFENDTLASLSSAGYRKVIKSLTFY